MRLCQARVQKYRSIDDTEWFDVETYKTIFVGPNEAGKTAVLRALQQINRPDGVAPFNPLRDYPRSQYNDISSGRVSPSDVTVVQAKFELDADDLEGIPKIFQNCKYVVGRRLDDTMWHHFEGSPEIPVLENLKKDLARLAAHVDQRQPPHVGDGNPPKAPSAGLSEIVEKFSGTSRVQGDLAKALKAWLEKIFPLVDEDNEKEESRHQKLLDAVTFSDVCTDTLSKVQKRIPIFVLFSNYFRVKPSIHLDHLATRVDQKLLDDDQYDYGNICLLKLLGFSARDLSNMGKIKDPAANDAKALQAYKDQLDKRSYNLNAAEIRLTSEIRDVWKPIAEKGEADRLRLRADGQYLKVVVEDDLGVEIELDQRSEGFQWLVSFFVVFFAEASDKHENAILLLDEPGLSLHGLKQRDFRDTISKLAASNQTLYTTHSPFLVGPDELDLVRVVEMTSRSSGTKVHTEVTAKDPAALLPLQEALGYDLAQSLFAQRRNLVLEGLTDYWYVEAVAELFRSASITSISDQIALVPAKSAGKVVYYATILHSQRLKVAALLDSDNAGDTAAQQDTLVHTLGNKRILRTKDAYSGKVTKPEIEDLLRDTLITVVKDEFSSDITKTAASQPTRSVVDIFEKEVKGFSKYKCAKAFIRWTRAHEAKDLTSSESQQWQKLFSLIDQALK